MHSSISSCSVLGQDISEKAEYQTFVLPQMATGAAEEPILPRLDRLDNMLRQLEEIRGCSRASPKSSTASSPSSEGHPSSSSLDLSSPKSLEKLCRPLDRVVMETELKGTLLQRLDHVEDRLLKLCIQLEEEVEAERRRRDQQNHDDGDDHSPETQPHKKKGLIKGLVNKVISPRHHAKHTKPQ